MIVLWTGKWWIWPLRGIAAIIFGMLALLIPGIGLEVLISFLGAFLLVDGASDIVASISHYKDAKY